MRKTLASLAVLWLLAGCTTAPGGLGSPTSEPTAAPAQPAAATSRPATPEPPSPAPSSTPVARTAVSLPPTPQPGPRDSEFPPGDLDEARRRYSVRVAEWVLSGVPSGLDDTYRCVGQYVDPQRVAALRSGEASSGAEKDIAALCLLRFNMPVAEVTPPSDGAPPGEGPGPGPGAPPVQAVEHRQPALPQPPASPAVTEASRRAPSGDRLQVPPDLNRISVSAPDEADRVIVAGAAGAVPGGSAVYVLSLEPGEAVRAQAAADGSFSASVVAPEGTTLVINHGAISNPDDPVAGDWLQGSPALQLTANAVQPSAPDAIPFTTGGSDGNGTGYWIADGVANGWSFVPGALLEYRLTFTYASPEIPQAFDTSRLQDERYLPRIALSRVGNAQGDIVQSSFIPALLTPTGLPIFDRGGYEQSALSHQFRRQVVSAEQVDDGLKLTAVYSLILPADLPAGHYVGLVSWQPSRLISDAAAPPPRGSQRFGQGATANSFTPAFQVGESQPPRFPWLLMGNTLSNGTRGVVAREDRDRFHLGTKVSFNADTFVVSKGSVHRLEPYLPTVGYAMGGPGRPVPPLLKFLFPSGALRVTVTRPDGATLELGTAPFRASRTVHMDNAFGPTSIQSLYELTTFDPSFDYRFDQYGQYVIHVEGWVRDATGIAYHGGGTYDVYVAEPLDLDLGTFLGTPFEVGDVMSPVVHARPGVPAHITVDFRLFPDSSVEQVERVLISGKANRFGYFHPGAAAQRIAASAAGEYVVDVTARYTDQSGALWMGAAKGASVVETPNSSVAARGKRGITNVFGSPTGGQPAWFFANVLELPRLTREQVHDAVQPFYPYFTGDVLWAADDTGAGIFPLITLHDPEGVTRLGRDPANAQNATRGELDLKLPDVGGLPAVQYPERIETWAYYYTSVLRPGVVVRSFVGSGEVQRAYWQFGDRYNGQLGNGDEGDLPGDVKLQYGGAVYRDEARRQRLYAIYGSMATMVARDDPLGHRVTPPFQGKAGGPDGGPLVTVKGQEVDIFFTPVGVMPGSVLEVGDTFSFSGAMWPTLPSRVDISVTTPSGQQVTAGGRASKIGYFHRPQDDFLVAEPGVYTVGVTVTHDGQTSAGALQEPYPTGGILGSLQGTYQFYVVPSGEAILPVTANLADWTAERARVVLNASMPQDLSGTKAYVTVGLSGTVLDERELPVSGGAVSYVYDVAQLRRDFPNLDAGRADTVVITISVSGTNAAGQGVARAASVLIQGDTVYAP